MYSVSGMSWEVLLNPQKFLPEDLLELLRLEGEEDGAGEEGDEEGADADGAEGNVRASDEATDKKNIYFP